VIQLQEKLQGSIKPLEKPARTPRRGMWGWGSGLIKYRTKGGNRKKREIITGLDHEWDLKYRGSYRAALR